MIKELIDLYAKELDWKNKLIEKRDILDWLKTYGIVNNGYGKEITWDFFNFPYGLSEHIKKKNKSIKAKRNRNKKKSFTSTEPRYNDIVRAVRKGKADRNKDHKFVSTTHAFKMMGGLAKFGSYGEGLTLNKLIDKKDQIERGRKLSDIQRRELDYEIERITNYTPKRANPNKDWIQGAFKEIKEDGTSGAFTRYCKAKFGATTVSQRIKCAKTIKRDYEQGKGNFDLKTYRRAVFYLNIVKASRDNPQQLSLFQKKNPEIDEFFDGMGKHVESNLNSKEYSLYDTFLSQFNEIQRNILMYTYGILPKQEEEEEIKEVKVYTSEEIKEILNSDEKDEKGGYKRTNFMDLYISPYRPIPSSDYGKFVKEFDLYELNDTQKRELGLERNKFYYLADASKIVLGQVNDSDTFKKWKAYQILLERNDIKNIAPNRYYNYISTPALFIYGGIGKDAFEGIKKRIAKIDRFANKEYSRGLNELLTAMDQSLSNDPISLLKDVYYDRKSLGMDILTRLEPIKKKKQAQKIEDTEDFETLLIPSLQHLIKEVEPNVFETTTNFSGKSSRDIDIQLIYHYDTDKFQIKLLDVTVYPKMNLKK